MKLDSNTGDLVTHDELVNVNEETEQFVGKIVEVGWDTATKKWVVIRAREDKPFPNSDWVVEG